MLKSIESKDSDREQELIKAFIEAASSTVEMMAGVTVERQPEARTAFSSALSGAIGFTGERLSGCMALCFEKSSILSIVSKMFMEEFTECNPEVADAVGEITNITLGTAKRRLQELGFEIGMSQPIVTEGNQLFLHQMSDTPPSVVYFSVDSGMIRLEISFTFAD